MPQQVINQYKIREANVGKDKQHKVYSIGLPPNIAQPLLDDDEDRRFAAEFTDDGILFRPVENVQANVPVPTWARS